MSFKKNSLKLFQQGYSVKNLKMDINMGSNGVKIGLILIISGLNFLNSVGEYFLNMGLAFKMGWGNNRFHQLCKERSVPFYQS